MVFKFVRVECVDLGEPAAPLLIDLLVNNGGQFKDGPPYAGWWGNYKSTNIWPFVAKKIDGVYMMDFGSDESTSQLNRYELFNLLHGAIEPGRRFEQKYGDDWYSFRISRLVDMATGSTLD